MRYIGLRSHDRLRATIASVSVALGTRRLSSIAALVLIIAVAALTPDVARAQLAYDHTSFVPGFGSGPEIWTMGYSDLYGATPPNYLSQSVVLQTVGLPNTDARVRYSEQIANLASFLGAGGTHVLVGHSLGAMVSRGAYINYPGVRANVAGIITVSAPHQGAPLADNANQATAFFADVQRRVNDGIGAIRAEATVVAVVAAVAGQPLFVAIGAFVVDKSSGQTIDLGNVTTLAKIPAIADLSPSSAAVQSLNANTADAQIPRANIYATIPSKNAAIRIKYSLDNNDAGFNAAVSAKNKAVTAFKVCKYVGYATIILGSKGRKCAYAAKVLQRIDERWAFFVNGPDQYGRTRDIPFDGIVPNERSRYPSPNGVAYQADVSGVDHQNIYKTRAGLDQVKEAMLLMGMISTGNTSSSTMSADISGPDAVNDDWYSTWQAQISGGVAPYSYSWSGILYGSGSSVSGSLSTSGDLTLNVTDATGAHVTVTKSVTATGCTGANLC